MFLVPVNIHPNGSFGTGDVHIILVYSNVLNHVHVHAVLGHVRDVGDLAAVAKGRWPRREIVLP